MRRALLLLVLLPGTGPAQWRRFGDPRPPASQISLPAEMLAAHNSVRARLGETPLSWSDTLADYAAKWAEHLIATGRFDHRTHPDYGENLFEITGAPATPSRVVSTWASEARDYDYRSNACRGICGHYTQIVWSATRQLGCAVARGAGREVWVCNYNPPGNWQGERPW